MKNPWEYMSTTTSNTNKKDKKQKDHDSDDEDEIQENDPIFLRLTQVCRRNCMKYLYLYGVIKYVTSYWQRVNQQ